MKLAFLALLISSKDTKILNVKKKIEKLKKNRKPEIIKTSRMS